MFVSPARLVAPARRAPQSAPAQQLQSTWPPVNGARRPGPRPGLSAANTYRGPGHPRLALIRSSLDTIGRPRRAGDQGGGGLSRLSDVGWWPGLSSRCATSTSMPSGCAASFSGSRGSVVDLLVPVRTT